MLAVAVLLVAAGAVAVVVYLGRERLGAAGLGLAALRTIGLGALVLALVNPGWRAGAGAGPATVLLDGSLSMAGGRWREALDSARSAAGPDGVILRFGTDVAPFDTAPPAAGATRLIDALRAAAGRGGPVRVVTDGEIDDAAAIPPSLLRGVTLTVLRRDTVPNAALLEVSLPARLRSGDSLAVSLLVGAWGRLRDTTAWLEVGEGARRLARIPIRLPPPPGTARRSVTLPAGALARGPHILRFSITAAGDAEPRDDTRLRVVTVTADPAVVVVVDPADWEGRFLVSELARVATAATQGYARIANDRWVDMHTLAPVRAQDVTAAVRAAGVLVIRGRWTAGMRTRQAVWRWPAGTEAGGSMLAGDWYVGATAAASPLASGLAGVLWDSVPPLLGLMPLVPEDDGWVGVTTRLGRRGAERPVVVGRDSAGARQMLTAGAGLWRWSLRGGAAREAYRALLAGGIDWLLGAETAAGPVLTASDVVARGLPVAFRWRGDARPDSITVSLSGHGPPRTIVLHFDPDGVSRLLIAPGTYRWATSSPVPAQGVIAVEEYSDEVPPRAVTASAPPPSDGLAYAVRHARDRWWLFVLAVAAFVAEWAWRQRRGLP